MKLIEWLFGKWIRKIVRKKLYGENINKELEKIIKKLKEIKFPKYHEEKMFEIEEWK